jgi:hypothetical protein
MVNWFRLAGEFLHELKMLNGHLANIRHEIHMQNVLRLQQQQSEVKPEPTRDIRRDTGRGQVK